MSVPKGSRRGAAATGARLVYGLAVALALVTPGAGDAQVPVPAPAQNADERALVQLERDWDAAFARRDAGFIESILADEFIVTYGDGSRGDKRSEVALAVGFDQQVDARRLDEFTVKVLGDTAVVWFSQHLTGPRQGQPVTVTYRYMDVFVRRGGRWLAIASQSTRVGERPGN